MCVLRGNLKKQFPWNPSQFYYDNICIILAFPIFHVLSSYASRKVVPSWLLEKKLFMSPNMKIKLLYFLSLSLLFAILLDASNSHRYWIPYNSPNTRVNVILIYIKIPSCMYMSKMAVFRIIREYIENENDITFSWEILEHYPA